MQLLACNSQANDKDQAKCEIKLRRLRFPSVRLFSAGKFSCCLRLGAGVPLLLYAYKKSIHRFQFQEFGHNITFVGQ